MSIECGEETRASVIERAVGRDGACDVNGVGRRVSLGLLEEDGEREEEAERRLCSNRGDASSVPFDLFDVRA